jgi:hypothetical protein
MLLFGQNSNIAIKEYAHGVTLQVNDQDFMINGMNWDYFPIGTNYSYSLWNQSESTIKAALDAEMSLLKKMGVNCIRQYTGVPSKWITYIYKNYGIYTMLNHSFGRYGVGLEGKWVSHTDYGHPKVQKQLLKEVISMAKTYQNTDGLLLFLLGNENNYGLFWEGAETENIPAKDQKSKALARNMYRLFNKAVVAIKAIDKQHPVAICNGDLLFIDIIAEECKDIDIFGTNVYRGATFTDAFSKVKEKLNKPIMFTEFGTDAYDVIKGAEDQKTQAYYLVNNWKDIYQNAAGLEKTGNAIGGFTFQFSDGWWKYGQTKNLSVHDTNASWANEGYTNDFKKGHNNMNEEWFGICAKGPTNSKGLYTLHPRAAYYALKAAHQLNPYQKGTTIKSIEDYFNKISLDKAVRKAQKNN